MQAFDLVPEYHVLSSPVRKAFKMIGALPFVEPGSVVEFWDVLKANCPSDMDAFCDYFEYTWIGNSTRAPVFEKFLWNQYDTVLANLPGQTNGGRLAQRVPVACRDYQPYPVDLPFSSQKRRNLDLQEESGLEDEKSSRTTEEQVERPQQPFKRSR